LKGRVPDQVLTMRLSRHNCDTLVAIWLVREINRYLLRQLMRHLVAIDLEDYLDIAHYIGKSFSGLKMHK
jgi:hypothetical protein